MFQTYSLVLINFEYIRAKLHSWTTMGTWLLAFLCSAVQLQSMVSIFRNEVLCCKLCARFAPGR